MATLLRQKGGTSIGPIGIITPSASLAKAQSLENSAKEIDHIRSRYLTDQISKANDRNQDKLEATLLDTAERWTNKFYEVREDGEEGLKAFDAFALEDIENVVATLNPSIQEDARNTLKRMALTESGTFREELYQEAKKAEILRENALIDRIIVDIDNFSKNAAYEAEDNISLFDAELDAYLEGLTDEVPEDRVAEIELAIAQIRARDQLTIKREADAKLERVQYELHLSRSNQQIGFINSRIDDGASYEEIDGLIQGLRQQYRNSGQYETAEGADFAAKGQIYGIMGALLAREALALQADGDFDAARNLIAAYGRGDEVIPKLAGFEDPNDLSQVVNIANTELNRFALEDTASIEAALAADKNYRNLEDALNENASAVPESALTQAPVGNTPLQQQQNLEALRVLRETNLDLQTLAWTAGLGRNAESIAAVNELNGLSSDIRMKALRLHEARFGWGADEALANPQVLADATKWSLTTGIALPSVTAAFNTAALMGEEAPMLFVQSLFSYREFAKEGPTDRAAIIGRHMDLYERVDALSGESNDPAIIMAAYRAAVSNVPMDVSTEKELQEWNEKIENNEVYDFFVDTYWDDRLAGTIINSFMNESSGAVYNWTTTETIIGTSGGFGEPSNPKMSVPPAYGKAWADIYKGVGSHIIDGVQVGTAEWLQYAATPWIKTAGLFGLDLDFNAPRMIEDSPIFPSEDSEAYRFIQAQAGLYIREGVAQRPAMLMAVDAATEEGFGISMFADESLTRSGDNYLREFAFTKDPFENYVQGNLDVALTELLVAGTTWLRAQEGHADTSRYARIDLSAELDAGRVTITPVDNFNPNSPKFNVLVYPSDESISVFPVKLFFDANNPTGAFTVSGTFDGDRARASFEAMQNLGIENGLIASLGSHAYRAYSDNKYDPDQLNLNMPDPEPALPPDIAPPVY